jgi:hypothetical protein
MKVHTFLAIAPHFTLCISASTIYVYHLKILSKNFSYYVYTLHRTTHNFKPHAALAKEIGQKHPEYVTAVYYGLTARTRNCGASPVRQTVPEQWCGNEA